MRITYSDHWKKKKELRPTISDEMIIYALSFSKILKDKHWENARNAVCKIPENGRTLKVIYRTIGKETRKIITAFWMD